MWRPRLFRVEDLAYGTDTVLIHMWDESAEKLVCADAIFGINFEPGIDERADQPGPNRPLMIGGISRTNVAKIS